MPTIIGFVFFAVGAYCFLLQEECLLGLLLIAGVFEAASALNFGDRGIQPYYIIAAFIILRGTLNLLSGIRPRCRLPHGGWLCIFGVVGIASAFVLPSIFAGTPIYDAKVGIDLGFFVRPPLHFGLNNVGQAGFLAWHLATAFASLNLPFSPIKTHRFFLMAFYITIFFVFAQALFQFAGFPFPDSLIRNNPGYALTDSTFGAFGIRNSGTFTEPSVVGAFLLFFLVGFTVQYLQGRHTGLKVLLALAASGAVASSGSIFVMALFLTVILLRYAPVRFPWYINPAQLKRQAWLLLLLAAPLVLILLAPSGVRDLLATLTVSKGDSSSFINRTAADIYGFQLLAQTHLIGVGLGSNRASSLLPNLLSNVGLLGTVVFAVFCVRLLKSLPPEYAWFRWAVYALLFNMCTSIPDITLPILWIALILAIQFATVPETLPAKEPDGLVGEGT